MKITIKTLIVVLLTVMSFSTAQAFDCTKYAPEYVMGEVCKIQLKDDLEPSKIWIDKTGTCDFENYPELIDEIIGFPFGNLTLQLSDELGYSVEINPGDCMSIEYIIKTSSGDPSVEYNKWCTLLVFYDDLGEPDCDICPQNAENCFDCEAPGNSPIERKPHKAKKNK